MGITTRAAGKLPAWIGSASFSYTKIEQGFVAEQSSCGRLLAGRTSNCAEPVPSAAVESRSRFPFAKSGNGSAVKQSASETGFALHCIMITV